MSLPSSIILLTTWRPNSAAIVVIAPIAPLTLTSHLSPSIDVPTAFLDTRRKEERNGDLGEPSQALLLSARNGQ
ncbi:hypothetical protein K523DRAFT_359207, partial [Schizophyllum commune Tattone D]